MILRFLKLTEGLVVGQAIATAYADDELRQNTILMDWLTAAGSKFWVNLEIAGIAKLDAEKKVVIL